MVRTCCSQALCDGGEVSVNSSAVKLSADLHLTTVDTTITNAGYNLVKRRKSFAPPGAVGMYLLLREMPLLTVPFEQVLCCDWAATDGIHTC